MDLAIRPREGCRHDLVSLGEVMLRLDPGDLRISTARSFRAWEGGGEYNVARGLRRCFGLSTAVVTALVDNPIGRLIEDLMLQGGVDQGYLRWVPTDGVGRSVRNGLNFTERGFGLRGAVGCSDRGHTAASQLRPGQIDWERIFGGEGARWFHTGGIFAALSETTAQVAEEAMRAARKHGTIVSYDLNYRASLWKGIGGKAWAREVNRELARHVDVMLGNEEDFTAALGFRDSLARRGLHPARGRLVPEDDRDRHRPVSGLEGGGDHAAPGPLGEPERLERAAPAGWPADRAPERKDLEILDRVGGGDSFASGLIYGFLSGRGPQWAVERGAAHGALAMTTPGDTSMATLAEVEKAMKGLGTRVER